MQKTVQQNSFRFPKIYSYKRTAMTSLCKNFFWKFLLQVSLKMKYGHSWWKKIPIKGEQVLLKCFPEQDNLICSLNAGTVTRPLAVSANRCNSLPLHFVWQWGEWFPQGERRRSCWLGKQCGKQLAADRIVGDGRHRLRKKQGDFCVIKNEWDRPTAGFWTGPKWAHKTDTNSPILFLKNFFIFILLYFMFWIVPALFWYSTVLRDW